MLIKLLETLIKIALNQEQIKRCLETISRQMNIEILTNKNESVEKIKTMQKEEMEVY